MKTTHTMHSSIVFTLQTLFILLPFVPEAMPQTAGSGSVEIQQQRSGDTAADNPPAADTICQYSPVASDGNQIVDTSADTSVTTEATVIDGIIIVKETGRAPLPTDSVTVFVDSMPTQLLPEGEFSALCSPSAYYSVAVHSPRFADIHQSVPHNEGKTNYFVTIVLENKPAPEESGAVSTFTAPETSYIAWTISGSIVDSRYELPIQNSEARLLLDDDSVPISSKGNYEVKTFISGRHTFHLTISGYHPVSIDTVLDEKVKQLYIIIPTTILSEAIARREITVSADALPLHRTAQPSKIELSRKELKRSTATMNDPIRALQTLPGVTSESDVSARPLVRGGDELEARVFLDGIPLLQPYHFGGVRSTFNQAALSGLTFYKSGFPADLHNAQSAIIDAHSRIPSDDKKLSIETDINYLQYCVYAGVPLFGGKAGINASSQGSYYDAVSKAAYKIIGASSGNQQVANLSKLITLPDYRDFSAGFSFAPSAKFKLFVNELYNTDRTRFCSGDSVVDVSYNYYRAKPGEEIPIDTQVTLKTSYPIDTSSLVHYIWVGTAGISISKRDDGNPIIGKPYVNPYPIYDSVTNTDPRWENPDIPRTDSIIDVTYTYRTPAPGQKLLPDTTITATVSKNSQNVYSIPWESNNSPAESYYEGPPEVGKTYFDIDTLMEYRSHYNILYSTAQYLPTDDQIVNATVAWQSRGWDLDFPSASDFFSESIYDVSLNQINANLGWIWSGLDHHTVKAGLQLDFTHARYNVFLTRFLHEMIVSGSTNITDFWGPINGDTAMVLYDPVDGFSQGEDLYSFSGHLLVSFKGKRSWYNASTYLQDAWDITPRLHGDFGLRAEYGRTDHETWLSPRLNLRYTVNDGNELTATAGLYTQNNYDISAIALSQDLKPEKVWHGGTGITTRLLPWLEQTVDVYGKYYFDLLSEVISPAVGFTLDDLIKSGFIKIPDDADSADFSGEAQYNQYLQTLMLNEGVYQSSYVNDGRGRAWGIDYQLRFTPSDFWHGWISFSYGRSYRERRPGWRAHPFPLEKPILFSISNYYRLPKQYEIGVRYRYCSGIPYTSVTLGNMMSFTGSADDMSSTMRIGDYNDRRYAAYQRLDLRFSKGFTLHGGKGHFYTELWNSMNAPNIFGIDGKTKAIKNFITNFPVTIPFIGIDYTF